MEFLQVDVFADGPYRGNPLAVFPDASGLGKEQMQAIAREMNLSETSFVTASGRDSYDVRIFTPDEEVPFAGHPTIGTAWVLRHLKRLEGDSFVQRSSAGETQVTATGEELWLEREGVVGNDVESTDPQAKARIASALGLEPNDIGLEARELGRAGLLRPAVSEAGLPQLMVPLRALDALGRCAPEASPLRAFEVDGVYCFTAFQAGRVRARGFFPALGIVEDPATGSAAAALGLYLADRLGPIDLEILQGIEMGRPSRIKVRAQPRRVQVGGRCDLILSGTLDRLP